MVTENLKKFNTPVFPFTAIVGQEEMKLALQLNVIDPKIGGVMIMGDRGTGKSTTIRAIADLLPEIEVVKDDEVIGEGQLLGLQRGTEAVDEIKAPNECGIKFKGNIALEEGMKIQAYEIEIRQRSL